MIYFAAISCLLITSSCERAGIQTAQAVADDVAQQLTLRNNVDDCDDCNPDQECCCILYIDFGMQPGFDVDIIVCGFSKGPDACGPYSPGGSCPPFSGVEEVIIFDMTITSHYLCMRKGRPFRVFNSGSQSVTLRLVCDVDSPNPKPTNIILGPGESKFFNAGTDCNAPECD